MDRPGYLPVFEFTRGNIVESAHYGSIVVANAAGELVAWYGDPDIVTFLRSTSKPFQILPFLEQNGDEHYGIIERELAVMCASHSGTDEHIAVIRSAQAKTGVKESDLQCGIHPLHHELTVQALQERGEALTPNRHNCSGKHIGMLATALLRGLPLGDYLEKKHPVQQDILKTFAEMCMIDPSKVILGIDGCSAPVFAIPMHNAAWGFARLCDPAGLSAKRIKACRKVTAAMMANPDMVAGPDRFDTAVMQVGSGRILAKGGAEGYQGIGIMPGAIAPQSPALGIAIKVSDGDLEGRALPGVALEVLYQLGVLPEDDVKALAKYGTRPVHNWRNLEVGEARACFQLRRVGQ
jgi:L-asparaginase II